MLSSLIACTRALASIGLSRNFCRLTVPRLNLIQSITWLRRSVSKGSAFPAASERLPSFQKLAAMLLKHLEEILNYCRTHVTLRVVEAINGNIRMLINRGRGYKNMRYLLLKARRMAVTNTEYVAFQKTRKAA